MWAQISNYFSSSQYMPHGHCYQWQGPLVWSMVGTDTLIGLAYLSISLSLYSLVKKIKLPFSPMFLAFGLFIGACGLTHFMEVYNLWVPNYWLAAFIKLITAGASVATAILMFPVRPKIAAVSEAARISEDRRVALEALTDSLEQKVHSRTQELQRAVQVRDEFLAVASHELRTPITPVLLQLQMTMRDMDRAPEHNGKITIDRTQLGSALNLSFVQVKRMAALIDNLLDVTRIQSGQLELNIEKINLCETLGSVVHGFREQYSRVGSELKLGLPASLWVECDGVRIAQVFSNLLSNALKYGAGRPVTVNLSQDEDWVEIVIEDLGVGISDDKIPKVFDRFERASQNKHVSGLGLGLYICRQIAEAHGGSIEVKSLLGKGSTFIVRIPTSGKGSSRV